MTVFFLTSYFTDTTISRVGAFSFCPRNSRGISKGTNATSAVIFENFKIV